MSIITIPLNKMQNYIGKIGELIVKEFLKQNNIIIVAEEYGIPYIGARADFIITKNEEKKEKLEELQEQVRLSDLSKNEECLLEEYKGKKYTYMPREEFEKLRKKIDKKYPEASIFFTGDGDSLKFYDTRPLSRPIYEYIRENLCIVEVKTSATNTYPYLGGQAKTYSQWKHEYYDHILRVKLIQDFEKGFQGIIHEKDVERLLNDPKLY